MYLKSALTGFVQLLCATSNESIFQILTSGTTIEVLLGIANQRTKVKLASHDPTIEELLVKTVGNLTSSISSSIVNKLVHYGAIPFLGFYAGECCASEMQKLALWGLGNLACHDTQAAQ